MGKSVRILITFWGNMRVDMPMHVGDMVFHSGGLQISLVVSQLTEWPISAEWEVWETQ